MADSYPACGKFEMDYNTCPEKFSEPMVWIGIYIEIAMLYCVLAMAADLLRGLRDKKFWFPCKYFSLNAASITVIAVSMKLPVDLTSEMPTFTDQGAKVGSLALMCTMMANLMPSLASMDNKTLLANIIGLCILVITIIVNIWIQISTGVISNAVLLGDYGYFRFGYDIAACIYTAMILLLLLIMISSSLTILTSKEILESKYQATNKISLSDQSLQHIQMSRVEKLRQQVTRYWVMAESGSPQFVMTSSPLSTASGVICVIVFVLNLVLVFKFIYACRSNISGLSNLGGSPYMGSTTAIYITQSIGMVVGTISPISRCFSIFNFKLGAKWKRSYFGIFKVEKYWTQKLHEWKQNPLHFLSGCPRTRILILNSKNIILSLCILLQKMIVILCKAIRLTVIAASIYMVSCFKRCLAPLIPSRPDDIDEDLSNYVLQIDNETELAEKTLKRIIKSMTSFTSKAEKEQSENILRLLQESTGFKGVEIFDTDHVQPLLPVEPVNSWSLPIVTLTCLAAALPDTRKDRVESLLRSVGEGLSFAHLVEESLSSASEYVNIRKTTLILWHEVEHKCKWLDNPLTEDVFKGKSVTEILKWFADKAREIVIETNKSSNGEYLVDNPPKMLSAANSMYRITQTILLRFQSNIEPITESNLFTHINGMIADIFSACFTNIPRVITMRCHESVIEKRESSVKVAAKLLGKTTKIIERLEPLELPNMDDDKMAYTDEWRLYLKQSTP